MRSYLEAVHELNGERNRRIAGQLQEILAALNAAGIEPVLLKGVAYLAADLYRDPAARVIGDIDLLVLDDQLAAAVAALKAIGYTEAGPAISPSRSTTTTRPSSVTTRSPRSSCTASRSCAPCAAPAGEQVLGDARRLDIDGARCRLPALQDQVVHNIVHAQLADRHYWLARVPLRPLLDLLRLRAAGDDRIDWREVLATFDRAGHGSACRAWLMTAAELFGQRLPPCVRPDLRARIACWRIRTQGRHRWLMAVAAGYDYHRAKLVDLRAGPGRRRRLRTLLLHPDALLRYLQALRSQIRRAH